MTEPTITHAPPKGKGEGTFALEVGGKPLGHLTYTLSDRTLCVEYVEVSRELRGRKLGNRLVEAAVEWARANDRDVIAHCSFARAVLNQMSRVRK